MFLNFRRSIFLFSALLWVTCNSLSITHLFDTCYKKYPLPNITSLDAKSIVDDIDSFYKNFDVRYKELEMFIQNNMSMSDKVDVQFNLFTQDNQDKPEPMDREDIKRNKFNYKYPVQVLVHGLQPQEEEYPFIKFLRHALIVRGQQNVIVMSYPKVAKMPYTQALKYSYLVAKNAADFLSKLLKEFKIRAKKIHIIGFEFGGQVAGNIGSHIPGLARISALDPAGALFDRFPPKYRISPDDATFVDIIHTSARKFPRGLGLPMAAGHQDFYPNGGKQQPGCKNNITAEEAGGRAAADFKNSLCDRVRSIEYYVESICDRLCTFSARKCDNYKNYESSHCLPFLSTMKTMGFYAQKDKSVPKKSKFYLNTNSQYPFCSYLGLITG